MNNENVNVTITEDGKDFVVFWEQPKIIPPEFRLYYDEETGKVLFYTCEKPEGKYIVIDSETFACARPDIRVIDGKISKAIQGAIITKLMPDKKEGIECLFEDISILAYKTPKIKKQKWKLNVYELK